MVFRDGCHDPRRLGGLADLFGGPVLILWPVMAKDADAGCFGDGDDDLVRGGQPGISIGSVAVGGAVKPRFNPPADAPPALGRPGPSTFVLLSAW